MKGSRTRKPRLWWVGRTVGARGEICGAIDDDTWMGGWKQIDATRETSDTYSSQSSAVPAMKFGVQGLHYPPLNKVLLRDICFRWLNLACRTSREVDGYYSDLCAPESTHAGLEEKVFVQEQM